MSTTSSSKKRLQPGLDTGNIVDGPRKRQRDTANHPDQDLEELLSKSPSPPPTRKITLKIKKQQDPTDSGHGSVSDQGMKIWNVVKNAKDPGSGELLSPDFMKLPSKKLYPDYYQVIKRPTSMDEIKSRLDMGAYGTLQAVKADFQTMFTNAKEYNIPESGIWQAAHFLYKLVLQEYTAITGEDVEMEMDVDVDEEAASGSKSKSSKPTTLPKLLKSKLQKLTKKKDSTGRLYSEVFKEMPSKKLYPSYFQIIKKPMTFEIIERKIEKKEYTDLQSFANDIELIFYNAYTFNEEGSFVYNDAKFLQDMFRNLMTDLPPGFDTPSVPPNPNQVPQPMPTTKIKIKVANAPAPAAKAPAPSPTPAPEPPKPKVAQPTPAPQKAAPAPIAVVQKPKPNPPQPVSTPQYPYYPSYQQPVHFPQQAHPQTPAPAPRPSPPTTNTLPGAVPARAKPLPPKLIKGISLRTTPAGRRLRFDSIDNLSLRIWTLRLGAMETGVEVTDVGLFGEGTSVEEVKLNGTAVEGIDVGVMMNGNGNGRMHEGSPSDSGLSEEDENETSKIKGSRGRGRGRGGRGGRGRGSGRTGKSQEVEQLKERVEAKRWEIGLAAGSNVLEMKASGGEEGETWKVFLDRVA